MIEYIVREACKCVYSLLIPQMIFMESNQLRRRYNYGHIGLYALDLLTAAFGVMAECYMRRQVRRENKVYAKLVNGSRPRQLRSTIMVERNNAELLHWFVMLMTKTKNTVQCHCGTYQNGEDFSSQEYL